MNVGHEPAGTSEGAYGPAGMSLRRWVYRNERVGVGLWERVCERGPMGKREQEMSNREIGRWRSWNYFLRRTRR